MRFLIVATLFYFGMLVFWPVSAGMLLWAMILWVERGLDVLVWCRRQFFPVVAHRR